MAVNKLKKASGVKKVKAAKQSRPVTVPRIAIPNIKVMGGGSSNPAIGPPAPDSQFTREDDFRRIMEGKIPSLDYVPAPYQGPMPPGTLPPTPVDASLESIIQTIDDWNATQPGVNWWDVIRRKRANDVIYEDDPRWSPFIGDPDYRDWEEARKRRRRQN